VNSSNKMYFFLPQRAQRTQRKSGWEGISIFKAVRLCVSCALSVYICQEVLGVGKK
jgi:hypothetical protein